MIESKLGQRLAGLFLLIMGGGFTAWSWYTALNEGYYYQKLVALAPALAVGGLGSLFFPLDIEEFRAKHGVSKPEKFSHFPMVWKVLLFVALAVGLGNWYAISKW